MGKEDVDPYFGFMDRTLSHRMTRLPKCCFQPQRRVKVSDFTNRLHALFSLYLSIITLHYVNNFLILIKELYVLRYSQMPFLTFWNQAPKFWGMMHCIKCKTLVLYHDFNCESSRLEVKLPLGTRCRSQTIITWKT